MGILNILVRWLALVLTRTIYQIRATGSQNVPVHGPALLVANHVSYIDGFLIGSSVRRKVRFMVGQPHFDRFRRFFRMMHAIPVPEGRRKDVIISIRRARQELLAGHVVCIFAEGALTQTGNMLAFHRGLEKIVEGLNEIVGEQGAGGYRR